MCSGVQLRIAGFRLAAINHAWSKNFVRRHSKHKIREAGRPCHLTSSQGAVADAKRQKLSNVYAPVIEDAEQRKRATQAKPGEKVGQHRGAKVTQKVGEPKRHERETQAIRAKAAGTNRAYHDKGDCFD